MIVELYTWSWRLVHVWAYTFTILLVWWEITEGADLGRQYANPILPCLHVGWLTAVLIERLGWLAMIFWRRR